LSGLITAIIGLLIWLAVIVCPEIGILFLERLLPYISYKTLLALLMLSTIINILCLTSLILLYRVLNKKPKLSEYEISKERGY